MYDEFSNNIKKKYEIFMYVCIYTEKICKFGGLQILICEITISKIKDMV